ncbi:MAG TPA: hypothetical protein VLC54_15490, partial [Anaeromyxobacter sp.]|nr:hypothetical protein [Anaeromyxobacter sp.]
MKTSNTNANANATPLVVRQAHHERSMRAARPEPVEGRMGVPAASPTPTPTGPIEAVHPERSEAASAAERSRGTTPTPTPTDQVAGHPERSAA